MSKPSYHVPQPQRVRRITGSFAWIDHRLLRSGYLAVLTHPEQSLYLFLALAADRNGVSFYRAQTIAQVLGLDLREFQVARDRLLELGLLAFEPYSLLSINGFYQLLPVEGTAPDLAGQTLRALAAAVPTATSTPTPAPTRSPGPTPTPAPTAAPAAAPPQAWRPPATAPVAGGRQPAQAPPPRGQQQTEVRRESQRGNGNPDGRGGAPVLLGTVLREALGGVHRTEERT